MRDSFFILILKALGLNKYNKINSNLIQKYVSKTNDKKRADRNRPGKDRYFLCLVWGGIFVNDFESGAI